MKELIDKHASINLFKLLKEKFIIKRKINIYCEDNWKTTIGWEGQLEISNFYVYQIYLKLKNSIFTGT